VTKLVKVNASTAIAGFLNFDESPQISLTQLVQKLYNAFKALCRFVGQVLGGLSISVVVLTPVPLLAHVSVV
jgi:hypothetical protein